MKVLLFAVRSKHKKFFQALQKESPELYEIVHSKYLWRPSLKAFSTLNQASLTPAIDFAVEEFLIKSGLKLPRGLVRFYFKMMAYWAYLRYYGVMDRDYDAIVVWNGGKCRQRVALEIAKEQGMQSFFYENGLLPNRLVLDRKGINFENSVPRDRAFFEAYHQDLPLPQSLIPREAKDSKKFQEVSDALPQNYIFVPFQVDSDTQIITNSPWIKNMRELFDIIASMAKQTSYQFLLKEHPSSSQNYPDLHQRAEGIANLSFVNGHPTQGLIERSLVVITINSTVGIESLLFGKRVMVLGDAFYDIEGITKGIKDQKFLLKTLHQLDQWKFEEALVQNFLKYLYYDYLIPSDDEVYQHFDRFIQEALS